jgi:hypothetical protein
LYFGSSLVAFTLPLIAGAYEAKRTGNIRTGGLVGLWSGLISGLITFLSLMAITYLFLGTMLQDSENSLQFQESGAPNLVTFVIGDSLAGAIGHLVIGLVLGAGLGILGGMIGKVLAADK